MENKQKGSTTSTLIIVIALLVIGFGWYVYQNKINTKTKDIIQESPVSESSTKVDDDSSVTAPTIYKTYSFAGSDYVQRLSFEYPNNWTVKENSYSTPGDQASGKKGEVESITVSSLTGVKITIGGRQTQCQSSTSSTKNSCFKNITPITMSATDAESITVFDHLVSTMK